MYDALLFLHVLAAFAFVAGAVAFSGFMLGARPAPGGFVVAEALWGIGGVGTLIFGVWLALYVDGYGIFDGWIIVALLLWLAANGTGDQSRKLFRSAVDAGGAASDAVRRAAALNWVRVVLTVLLLADMVWKPGA